MLRRPEAKTLSDLRKIVHEEFARRFSPEIAGPVERYQFIAREIWAGWNGETFRPASSVFTRPGEALRIWSAARGDRFLNPGEVGVEWAWRLGHPSSYALLIGCAAPERRINLRYHDKAVFRGSLARGLDTVRWGLLTEYVPATLGALSANVEVTIAAHGEVGSSQRAFYRAARMLGFLAREVISDVEVWTWWDRALAFDSQPMELVEGTLLPENWRFTSDLEAEFLEDELARELSADHELFGESLKGLARCVACDEASFELGDGTFALVHLSFSHPDRPPWPITTRLDTSLALALAIQEHQHLDD